MAFVPGSVIECVNHKDVILTKGKHYEVLGQCGWQVGVLNDRKQPQFYDEARFKLVRPAKSPAVDSSALVVLCDAAEKLIAALRDSGAVVQSLVDQVAHLEQVIAFARS
jgi:hypothetical protein